MKWNYRAVNGKYRSRKMKQSDHKAVLYVFLIGTILEIYVALFVGISNYAAHSLGAAGVANPALVRRVGYLAAPVGRTGQGTGTGKDVEPDIALGNSEATQILVGVCKAKGYGDGCVRDLKAIKRVESGVSWNVSTLIGDHGLAIGAYQIHFRLHGITREQAGDLKYAATWTLNHLEANGYKKGGEWRKYAIGSHNSRTPSVNKKYYGFVVAAMKKMETISLK